MNYSTNWKKSPQPKKQRKYREQAPLHIKGKFMHVHLAKDLSKKHNKRAVRVSKGDRVKIMTGQFKGRTGRVDAVDTARERVFVEGIEAVKTDGTKVRYPLHPSNLMITELVLDDKNRKQILERK